MSDLIRLSLTTVNAPETIELARFCAEISLERADTSNGPWQKTAHVTSRECR